MAAREPRESLLEALRRVPDPRSRRGRRYELASVLAVALDGKTLRGIHGEELPGVHLVAAFTHQRGIVLTQEAAPGKGQELAAVAAVLEYLDLQGLVVTGDALLAQRGVCRRIVKKRALSAAGQGEPTDAV